MEDTWKDTFDTWKDTLDTWKDTLEIEKSKVTGPAFLLKKGENTENSMSAIVCTITLSHIFWCCVRHRENKKMGVANTQCEVERIS